MDHHGAIHRINDSKIHTLVSQILLDPLTTHSHYYYHRELFFYKIRLYIGSSKIYHTKIHYEVHYSFNGGHGGIQDII